MGINGVNPAQAAVAKSEEAVSSFQIGLMKKATDLQQNVVATLLQSLGVGNSVDLKA